MKKSFENPYVINVAGMKNGPHTDEYSVDKLLFEQFQEGIIEDGAVQVKLDMYKYGTHLDVKFSFNGTVKVPCDRCLDLYDQSIEQNTRIIYAFDPEMKFEGYEVMHVDPGENRLSLVQEFYDFITLSLPIRLVPDERSHQCSPEVLKYLSKEEAEQQETPEEESVDPRWAALKNIKFEDKN